MTSWGGTVDEIFLNRYDDAVHNLLDYVSSRIQHIEQNSQSLLELDIELDNIIAIFLDVLQLPSLPFFDLCELLKQVNKYLNMRGLYTSQMEWAQAVLRYFLDHEDETGDLIDLAILNIIASGYHALGDSAAALELYEFMIELYAHQSTHPGLAVVHHNMAQSLLRHDDLEAAAEHCRKSIEIDALHGNSRGMAMELMFLADLMFQQDRRKAGEQLMGQAGDLIATLDNHYLRALYTGNKAFQVAQYMGREQAEPLFLDAIDQWQALGDQEQLALIQFNYAVMLYETNNHEDALYLARKSLKHLEQHNPFQAERVRLALDTWQQELSSKGETS